MSESRIRAITSSFTYDPALIVHHDELANMKNFLVKQLKETVSDLKAQYTDFHNLGTSETTRKLSDNLSEFIIQQRWSSQTKDGEEAQVGEGQLGGMVLG